MATLQSTVGSLRYERGYNRGIVGDILITLWDLSQKPMNEIKVGDEILAHCEEPYSRPNEKPHIQEHLGKASDDWKPGVGFDQSHTGYNAHSKATVKHITKTQVSKLIKVTFGNDPEETIGNYEDFSITMTPNYLIQMSHDVGFECGAACPHIGWKTYDTEDTEIYKPEVGKLTVGDLGYRIPSEYKGYLGEPDTACFPKLFHGTPDYLDEMRIDNIEEIDDGGEYSFDVYHIDEVENGSMMFANNTILHMGTN